ncbi:uncharacterized protein [Coffea arabica]|uniref:Endonuclease/exonuclease/phosphatase domain-containing protein n=1 Tax=Coffea arabica TaxID=13443 RepID=A0ABM4WP86_COFAR
MTADKARLTYARVCVEIGVDDELPDSVEFVGEDDKWVSQPYIIGAWNIRGMNSDAKQSEIRNWIKNNEVSIFGLLETRVKQKNADRIARAIGPYLVKLDNYACHHNGSIWVFWDPSKASVKTIKLSSQFVHTEIVDKQSSLSLLATFVYASNSIDERECLWHDLVQLNVDSNCPWIVLGDFNTVLKMDEKIGGLMVNPRDRSFGNCLFDCGLDNLKWRGLKYTWTNKQDGIHRICCKLDRVLVNYG